MGSGKSARAGGVEIPEWLGREPHSSYAGYAPWLGSDWAASEKVWKCWEAVDRTDSLYGTHVAALAGDSAALDQMAQFYLRLTTLRITR